MHDLVLGELLSFPFGVAVREAAQDQFPSKERLLDYLYKVRALTCSRLERQTTADFDREV